MSIGKKKKKRARKYPKLWRILFNCCKVQKKMTLWSVWLRRSRIAQYTSRKKGLLSLQKIIRGSRYCKSLKIILKTSVLSSKLSILRFYNISRIQYFSIQTDKKTPLQILTDILSCKYLCSALKRWQGVALMFFSELLFNIFQLCKGMRALQLLLEEECLKVHWQSSYIHFSRTHDNSLWFPQTEEGEEHRKKEQHTQYVFTSICHLLTVSATWINMYLYSGKITVLSTCSYSVQLFMIKSKVRAFWQNQ